MQCFFYNRRFLLLLFFLILHKLILGNERDTTFTVLKLEINKKDTFLYEKTGSLKDKKVISVYTEKGNNLFIEQVFLNDKLITDNSYFSCNSISSNHYTYDSIGRLLNKYMVSLGETKDFYFYFQYFYSYDLHGNIISRYEIATTGDTTESIYYKYNNNELIEEHECSYKFDFITYYANGRPVKRINNKLPSGDFDEYWEYDSLGNLIVYQEDIYHKDVYSYNEYNKVEKIATYFIHPDSNTVEQVKKTLYEYDEKGRLKKEQIIGNQPTETYIYEYYLSFIPEEKEEGLIRFYEAPSIFGDNIFSNQIWVKIEEVEITPEK